MVRQNGNTRISRRDRGAAAVEMALVMPLLLMIICAIIDFGRMYNAQITLTQAAREGARASAYGQTAAQVQSRVALAAGDLEDPATPTSEVLITSSTACSATPADPYAMITVSYTFSFVTPFAAIVGMFGSWAPNGSYVLTSKAVVTCSG